VFYDRSALIIEEQLTFRKNFASDISYSYADIFCLLDVTYQLIN